MTYNRRGGQKISGSFEKNVKGIGGTIKQCPTAYSKYRKRHPFSVEIPVITIPPKRPKQFFKELIWTAFDKGWISWFNLNKIGFEYWAKDMKYKRERDDKK